MRVRLVQVCAVALVLSTGCGRLGFGLGPPLASDAGSPPSGMDATTPDATVSQDPSDGGGSDGAGMDASERDAAPRDAAPRDAEPTDASKSDAAQPADAAADDQDSGHEPPPVDNKHCPENPNAVFCDGFEDATASRWAYEIEIDGTAVRSSTRKRTGALALHATTTAANKDSAARFASTDLNGVKSGEIWMRFYDYLPSSTNITSHFSAGVLSEITEPYDGLFITVRPTAVGLGGMVGFNDGQIAFPRDRWVCVELHAHVDAIDGYFEVYLDGGLVVSSGHGNTVPAGGFTSAEVGIHYVESPQSGPIDVYVDDVILGFQRFGCN